MIMQTVKKFFLGLFLIAFAISACSPTPAADSDTTRSTVADANTNNDKPTAAADEEPAAIKSGKPNISHFPELSLPLTIDENVLSKNMNFRKIEREDEKQQAWFSENYSQISLQPCQSNRPPTLHCFHSKMNGNQYLVGIIYEITSWNFTYTLLYTQVFDSKNNAIGEPKEFTLNVDYNDGKIRTIVSLNPNEIRTTTANETWDTSGDDEDNPPGLKDEITTADSLFTFTANGFKGKQLSTKTRPTAGYSN